MPEVNLSFNAVVGLAITWVICTVLILDIWWLLPKLLRVLSRWVDKKVPLHLSEMERPIFRISFNILSVIVLFGGGVATAGVLGFDVSWAQDNAEEAGIAVAAWLGPRVARIAVVLVIGLLVMRAAARLIPPLITRYLSRRAEPGAAPSESEKREQTLSRAATITVNVLVVTLMFFIILNVWCGIRICHQSNKVAKANG